jgi:hypothetical protein
MLDLAISIDTDSTNTTIVETNRGMMLRAPGWPQDCDFQLVAFDTSEENCEVVSADDLAEDIGDALGALDRAVTFKDGKPDWYLRLARYASREPLQSG